MKLEDTAVADMSSFTDLDDKAVAVASIHATRQITSGTRRTRGIYESYEKETLFYRLIKQPPKLHLLQFPLRFLQHCSNRVRAGANEYSFLP